MEHHFLNQFFSLFSDHCFFHVRLCYFFYFPNACLDPIPGHYFVLFFQLFHFDLLILLFRSFNLLQSFSIYQSSLFFWIRLFNLPYWNQQWDLFCLQFLNCLSNELQIMQALHFWIQRMLIHLLDCLRFLYLVFAHLSLFLHD